MATAKSVLQVFGFGLAIASAVMVVGLVATMTKQPVAIVVTVGIACLLTGLLLWKLQSAGLGEYRDAVTIAFSLLVALSGGIYLAGAVHVFGDPQKTEAVVRTALGWCLAYYGCGFLVGFLFGIPRVLQGDNPPANDANPGGAAAAGRAGYAQRVNTNLEQISDWLTKIIVGLGLVELRTVPDHLYRASDWMARSFAKAETGAPSQAAASFSSAFIVFFVIAGFMAGYLITRLFLAGAFGRADQQQPPQTVAAPYQGGVDADIDRIKNFWKPGGMVDPAHEKLLDAWLTRNGIAESVVSFLSKPQYASQRAQAIRELQIPETDTAS